MLHRYILVTQRLRLVLRADQNLIQVLSDENLSSLHFRALGKPLLHAVRKVFLLYLHLLNQLENQAVINGKQTI